MHPIVVINPNSTEDVTRGIDDPDPFAVYLPTLLVVNKIDLEPAYKEDVVVFEELTGYTYPWLGVSAETGQGLEELGQWVKVSVSLQQASTTISVTHRDPRADDLTDQLVADNPRKVCEIVSRHDEGSGSAGHVFRVVLAQAQFHEIRVWSQYG